MLILRFPIIRKKNKCECLCEHYIQMWVIEEMRTFRPLVEPCKLYSICSNLDNITNWMQLTLQLEALFSKSKGQLWMKKRIKLHSAILLWYQNRIDEAKSEFKRNLDSCYLGCLGICKDAWQKWNSRNALENVTCKAQFPVLRFVYEFCI